MQIKHILKSQLDSGQHLLLSAASALSQPQFQTALAHTGVSAAWIFGHLAVNEDWFLSILTNSSIECPQSLIDDCQLDLSYQTFHHDKYRKNDMLDLFQQQRNRVLNALQSQDTTLWQAPAPNMLPDIFKTVGDAWGIISTHQYWHFGQLMSIRHYLGNHKDIF